MEKQMTDAQKIAEIQKLLIQWSNRELHSHDFTECVYRIINYNEDPETQLNRYDTNHGSPYDRGGADSYYRMDRNPHKGGVGGNSGPTVLDLTPDEVLAYNAGYTNNENNGDFKEYN